MNSDLTFRLIFTLISTLNLKLKVVLLIKVQISMELNLHFTCEIKPHEKRKYTLAYISVGLLERKEYRGLKLIIKVSYSASLQT